MRFAHCATEDTGVTPVLHLPCYERKDLEKEKVYHL